MSKKWLLMAVVVWCLAVSSFANAETTVTQYDNNISYSLTQHTNPFTAWTITITDWTDTITMLDRNLGATSNDITKEESYWKYFQWWNNDSTKFITGAQNWTWNENIGLWWWSVGDHIEELTNDNWKVNNAPQRQWPCPEWFHVPSYWELLKIQDMMWNNTDDMRTQLLIPLAGDLNNENGLPQDPNNAFWWSSSPYSVGTPTPWSWGLEFYDTGYYDFGSYYYFSSSHYNRSYGFSLRCVYNNYSLYPDFVAKIWEIWYYSLDEALEAALEAVEHNDKIVVIRDITIDHNITINHDITSDYEIIIESWINLTYKSNINISWELKLDDLSQLIPEWDWRLIINDRWSLTVWDELLIWWEWAIFTLWDWIVVEIRNNKKIPWVNYLYLDFVWSKDIPPITVKKSYTIDEWIYFHFWYPEDINLIINEPITVKWMIYAEFEHTTWKIITNGTWDLNGLKNMLSIQGDVSFDLNNSLKFSMTLHDWSSFLLPWTGKFGGFIENWINSSEFLWELDISIVIEDGAIITLPVWQKIIGPTDNLKAIKDWYTFDWWFIDEWLSIPFEFDTTYDTDKTLYPKFTKIPDPTPSYSGGGGHRRSVIKDTEKEEEVIKNKEENNEEVEEDNNKENNTEESELELAYEFAYKNWITTMDSIEKAELDQPLTRIAMAKMLSQYAMNVLGKVPANKMAPRFDDITPELNDEYYWWSEIAYQLNIMWLNMPDNKFRPFDLVTRAEFGTALSRLIYWLSDWTWAYYLPHLNKLKDEKIITNDNPSLKEARWYIMLMLMRSAKK